MDEGDLFVDELQKLSSRAPSEAGGHDDGGRGTHVVGYSERMKMRGLSEATEEIDRHFRAGAHMVMVGSEGITEDLPPARWRKDVIRALSRRFGYEKLMFEASDPPVYKWYLKNIGKYVNLFIDRSQIVDFNAWRLSLRGDPDIWRGKKLGHRPG